MAWPGLTLGARYDIENRRARIRQRAQAEDFDPKGPLAKLAAAVRQARRYIGAEPTRGHLLGHYRGDDFFAELFEDLYLVIWSYRLLSGGLARIEAVCHTGVLGISPGKIRSLEDAVGAGILELG